MEHCFPTWIQLSPDHVCLHPDAGMPHRILRVGVRLTALVSAVAELTYGLVHSHVVGKHVLPNHKLQPMPRVTLADEHRRLHQ